MATDAESDVYKWRTQGKFLQRTKVPRVIANSLTRGQLNSFGPRKDNVAEKKSCLQE